MKNTLQKKLLILGLSLFFLHGDVYAAKMYFDAPARASSNREPISVILYLDNQGESISGVGGDFSFNQDLFEVQEIIAGNSIIQMWGTSPQVAKEHYLDGRTHIIFDGVIPGGFNGVRTGHHPNIFPGVLYIVKLIPKQSGVGYFTLDNVEIRAFDEQASLLSTEGSRQKIIVPTLSGKATSLPTESVLTTNKTAIVSIEQSEFINKGASYLFVRETDPSLLIDHIEVAETNEYNPTYVATQFWHTVDNPYILSYQTRSKYIHVNIFYTNNTNTIVTIPPVENSNNFDHSSRILIYILIAITLLYHYGKIHYKFISTRIKKIF